MVVVRPGRDVLGAVVVAPSRSGVAPGSSGVAHVSTARIHDVIVRHPRSLRREAEAVGHPDLLLIDIVLGLTAEKDKSNLLAMATMAALWSAQLPQKRCHGFGLSFFSRSQLTNLSAFCILRSKDSRVNTACVALRPKEEFERDVKIASTFRIMAFKN